PSARETVFEAIRLARRAGRLVSLDSNLRLKLWKLDEARETIARAAALCDIFLPSLEDAFALSGRDEPDEVVEWAHAIGAKQVALKLGDEGALVRSRWSASIGARPRCAWRGSMSAGTQSNSVNSRAASSRCPPADSRRCSTKRVATG